MPHPSVESLVIAQVIGDVVDMFVPAPNVNMRVRYGSNHIHNGCELNPSALLQPRVEIAGDYQAFYTLILTNPDAPSPSNPTIREYLHWMVTDIPATSSANAGVELVSYEAPYPIIGVHRFVFVLFKQAAGQAVTPPQRRGYFNTRNFSRQHALGLPVAAMYFHARPEPEPRIRGRSHSQRTL